VGKGVWAENGGAGYSEKFVIGNLKLVILKNPSYATGKQF
jgi:hypothetical protein